MSVLASIRSEIVKFNGLVKEHLTSSNNTHASLNLRNLDTPSQYSFKPDDIIPLDDSVALVDHSYSKHPNTITLHSRKCKYLLQTHSIESMHLWISLINYSAAFKWANVRIRGHSLSDSHLHYAGLKARSRLHSSASTSEFARASTATSTPASTPASTPTSTPTPTSSQSSPQSPTSPTLNRVGDFDSAVDSISAHMHASSNAHSRSSKLKTKLAHLTRLQEENSAHLSDTLNKLELCGTLTPFRRSTRSRLNGELVAMLTGALAELRVAEAKYASVAATLAGDLAVEEKIEARSVSVGMRAAAVHSQASRVRRAQSMFVGEGVGDVGGEVGNLEGVQGTDHTTDHSTNHSPDALQHTASIRSNRTQKYSSATSLALQEQDNEEYPSNSTSTTATSSNNHYGHISVIKMPDAAHSDSLIIPRTPVTSLSSQIVLSEEAYTAALSAIIKRDFFPHLKAADELSASVNNWRGGGTPATTTAATPTPANAPHSYSFASLSLSEFQSRFTSEDNASFSYQLHKANKRRREVYRWAYDAEQLANERIQLANAGMNERIEGVHNPMDDGERKLLAATEGKLHTTTSQISQHAGEGNSQALVRREKQSMRELELGVEKRSTEHGLMPTCTSQQDNRSAAVTAWPLTAANNLMFQPDATTPNFGYRGHFATRHHEAENRAKRVTNYPATHLSGAHSDGVGDGESSATGSVDTNAINAAVNAGADSGASTPTHTLPSVRGYTFVESSSQPEPEPQKRTRGRVDKEEETVWDSPGDFKIPRLSRRDRLGQQLASQAQNKAKGGTSGAGVTPNTPAKTPRSVALSPAGHALLQKTKSRRDNGATDAPIRSRINQSPDIRRKDRPWTPTPK
ncbi:hypothetical protein E3P78_03384 [Wallemia ichthyophaga]|nr:hypothetical protein E3P78_03384 [Wallemia ichthyophaga]